MREPERSRNLALASVAAGPLLVWAGTRMPTSGLGQAAAVLLFSLGVMGVLYGGVVALLEHAKVRAQRRLATGDGVMAHWRIGPEDWRAFLALDAERNAAGQRPPNEFTARASNASSDVEVVVGEDAVSIDGSMHLLPRHGTPEVTRFEFDESRVRPSVIEFELRYPEGGTGASGTIQGPKLALLRFPVPAGAQAQARAIVAHFGQQTPGKPTFFHGPGDGSDPEDLTRCWNCGYETYRLVSGCERCGATMVSRRWARRFGGVLVVLGAFLASLMGFLLWWMTPMLLHPGLQRASTRFTGSRMDGLAIFALMSAVFVFGMTAFGYGVWQVITGKRSKKPVAVMLAIAGALYVVGTLMRSSGG